MNKRWIKRLSILLTSVLVTTAFYGCGANGNSTKTGSKVTLKVATYAGASELKEYQSLVNKLNAKSKDYKLVIQSIPSNYYQKIQTMISAKQAPDLMWLSQEYIPMYAKVGAIMDVTDKAKSDKKVGLSNYYSGPLDTAKYKGKLYGLPWISQPVVMYYNKDLFKEAGIADPSGNWKWEDFDEAAKKLTKDKNGDGKIDQWGTVIDGWPPINTWVWTYGGETIDKNGNVKLDSTEAHKGLNMLSKMINVDKISPDKEQAQNMGDAQLFESGKIGMFFGGAGDDIENQVNGKFKVGMAEIPYETKKSTFSWIASTVVSSQTKNKDVAYEALVDLTNAIQQWKIVAPTKSGLSNVTKVRPEKAYALDVIKKSSAYARGFNNQEKEAEIDTALSDELYEPIMFNKKSADQGIKDAVSKIKSIMGQ